MRNRLANRLSEKASWRVPLIHSAHSHSGSPTVSALDRYFRLAQNRFYQFTLLAPVSGRGTPQLASSFDHLFVTVQQPGKPA